MINWDMVDFFTEDEWRCKCGCGCTNVSLPFLNKIVEARKIAGISFNPTSGCRCVEHNLKVGGKEHSLHICTKSKKTSAVDISANTSRKRGIIIRALFEAGLVHIGINFKDKFIHVDDSRKIMIFPY